MHVETCQEKNKYTMCKDVFFTFFMELSVLFSLFLHWTQAYIIFFVPVLKWLLVLFKDGFCFPHPGKSERSTNPGFFPVWTQTGRVWQTGSPSCTHRLCTIRILSTKWNPLSELAFAWKLWSDSWHFTRWLHFEPFRVCNQVYLKLCFFPILCNTRQFASVIELEMSTTL